MKAFVITEYDKKGKLHLTETPHPVITENEVLVEIHAAGINQLDAKIKSGAFKLILPYKMPLILGHDLAGVITQVGAGVTRFKAGDEVYARAADHHIGTFAEYIAISENDIAVKPKNISMAEAASLPLVALTAWQALVEKAALNKGQTVFIQAGSGGVGTIAIQLAKHLGATVATTTSSANINLVRSLGADVVIDYKKDDFEKILKNYDVVLNSQDINTLEKSLRIVKPHGKLISISGPPDPTFAKEMNFPWYVKLVIQFLSAGVRTKSKRLHIDYSFLYMKADGQQLNDITALIDNGIICPVVDKVFPFEQTSEALTYVEQGHAKGKVVIKMK